MSYWFFGTPEFARTILAGMVEAGLDVSLAACQPDRPKGRGHKMQMCEVKTYALEQGIEVYQTQSLKTPEAREQLEALAQKHRPTVAIVASYGLILPQWLLDLPEHGFVNVHASLLPRWRGASPIAHAIWAGDSQSGVCLMRVVQALDAGGVFSRKVVPITGEDDGVTLENKLAEAGATLLVKDLPKILAGKLTEVPQSEEGLTYAARLTKESGALDWNRPAAELARQVRALQPWPGTWTRAEGKMLKVLRAKATGESGAPGEVIDSGNRLVVACGEGALELHEVQLEGKKAMSADALLRGFAIAVGTVLSAAPQPNPAPR